VGVGLEGAEPELERPEGAGVERTGVEAAVGTEGAAGVVGGLEDGLVTEGGVVATGLEGATNEGIGMGVGRSGRGVVSSSRLSSAGGGGGTCWVLAVVVTGTGATAGAAAGPEPTGITEVAGRSATVGEGVGRWGPRDSCWVT